MPQEQKEQVEWIPTGLVLLDKMLGGGIPKGKVIEVFGYEGCGKTTLAIEISKAFESVYYIDFEHELNLDYVTKIGAKFAKFTQPESFEAGVDEFFHDLKKGKKYDLMIIDTIGSSITTDELEADVADFVPGQRAAKVTFFLKKAEKILKPLGISLLLLNHKKDRFNAGYGDQFYTPGGRQILHTSSIRLSVTKKQEKTFDDGSIITNIWQKRNKVVQEMDGDEQNCMYVVRRGMGISRGEESFRLGIECGTIGTKGQSFILCDKEFRGKKAIIEYLDENIDDIREVINDKWLEANKSK